MTLKLPQQTNDAFMEATVVTMDLVTMEDLDTMAMATILLTMAAIMAVMMEDITNMTSTLEVDATTLMNATTFMRLFFAGKRFHDN